jgi:hypothetical protein
MRISKLQSFHGDRDQAATAHKIAHNTFERMEGDTRIIRLHNTDIVSFSGGDITLDSGGWQSVTTKGRMNEYLPSRYSIYQKNYVWTVCGDGHEVPFYDGMTLPSALTEKHDTSESVDLAKQIDKFVKLLDDGIPEIEGGDCFMCMANRSTTKPGEKGFGGTDHLISHLEESYLTGSLVYAAMLWAGYSDPRFILSMAVQRPDAFTGQIKRTVKRYLRRELGLVS